MVFSSTDTPLSTMFNDVHVIWCGRPRSSPLVSLMRFEVSLSIPINSRLRQEEG